MSMLTRKFFTVLGLSFLILFLVPALTQAADISTVQQQLLSEIKQANIRHQSQVNIVGKERTKLLKKLAEQESQLKQLNRQVAAITRNRDEQSVSLEGLEQRLSNWQQQVNYLHHLFDGLDSQSQIRSPEALQQWLASQTTSSALSAVKAALPNGDYVSGQRLSLGPLNWFVSDNGQDASFIQYQNSQWLVVYRFDEQQTLALAQLSQQAQQNLYSTAVIAVDPSNNRNITLAQHKESLLDHLDKGGIWVVPILAFALLALVIASVKALALSRLTRVQPLLNLQQQSASMGQYQQALVNIARQYQGVERDDKLLDALMISKRKLEKGLSVIAVTASVAPLLGLLGTVSGMIQTFKLMTLFGAGDANAVSGGISESLVTTELGLIVAIPALVAHALMSRKCQHYLCELESFAVHLSHSDSSKVEESTQEVNCAA